MKAQKIKKELFFIKKAFFEYHQGLSYLYHKYYLAKKIYRLQIIEKKITNANLSVHVLTGRADFTMLLWSLYSFYHRMPEVGQLYIHNDGSLNQHNVDMINKLLPSAKIIHPTTVLGKLAEYPVLKKFRTEFTQFFLLKKIIDTFFVSDSPLHLIIDSDIFWFNEPTEIVREIKNNAERSLAMKNSKPCFVYFKTGVLDEGRAMVNTGVVLYNKRNFNLQKLSRYLERIDIDNMNNSHFIEQAGFASALENLEILPEKRYSIKGKLSLETAVRHYTSPRRPLFFIEAIPTNVNRLF